MWRNRDYYTLIGSLPALPPHFEDAERVPISGQRLDEHLKMLDPEAAEVIDRLRDFLLWDRQPLDRSDDEFCRHYEQIVAGVNDGWQRLRRRRDDMPRDLSLFGVLYDED